MILTWLSRLLANFLTKQIVQTAVRTSTFRALEQTLRPGDILLVDGNTRISVAIKYLTQSNWSHAALYLGPQAGLGKSALGEPLVLIEADVVEGIRTVPLSSYRNEHTRICRPVGLQPDDLKVLADYAKNRLGQQYDLKNVFDLARYLFATPPVPVRFRRRMLALGSGDPTRAICSTFIAQAFQRIHYPILPDIRILPVDDPKCHHCVRELYRIRHHSLFTPRDFDASPYFQIIKPTLERGFDYQKVEWEG